MFSPRSILLIKNFDFEREGAEPKAKFMIVLLQTATDAIIAPLTTSKDFIPDSCNGQRCVIDKPSCLHCYCIPGNLAIGKNGFSFSKNTYIQVQGNLTKRSISDLRRRYQDTNTISLIDELTDAEYCDLLYCIYKSEFVPRGIRKAMEPIIEELERKRTSA